VRFQSSRAVLQSSGEEKKVSFCLTKHLSHTNKEEREQKKRTNGGRRGG
jgi:hypothetical protein